jgi:membrane dipeptidase
MVPLLQSSTPKTKKIPYMLHKSLILIAFALLLSACKPAAEEPAEVIDYAAEARRIVETSIIVDTHVDVPFRLQQHPQDVSTATPTGDFDYPRAVTGGLNAPFMSIYTEASLEAQGGSREAADELIDIVEGIVAGAPDKFAIARSPAEVREHFENGVISLPLGMENGSPLEGSMAALKHFYDRGIRYITLSHSLSNHLSDSSYDSNHQWGGLSDFGAAVILEMNRYGIMVDVSHVSDEAFWDVLEVSQAPVIASHSSARHFTPDWERNMSDEMIIAMADKGGVIQINFGSSFITQEAREYSTPAFAALNAWMAEDPENRTMALAMTDFYPKYIAEHGMFPYASVDDVLDHFDHVVALVGIDHVGIGSDYDGVGDTLPTGLKDVSTYPNLVEGFLKRGYSEEDIRKILGGNILRVWEEIESRAVRKQT